MSFCQAATLKGGDREALAVLEHVLFLTACSLFLASSNYVPLHRLLSSAVLPD